MTEKKNILFVVPSMNSGGVEIGIVEFAKKNYETKDLNIFLVSSGGLLINKLIHYDVKYFNINVKSKNPLIILNNIKKLKKIIKNETIDVVQVESRAPAWSCYYACKSLKVPLINVVQFNGIFKKSSILKKLYNSAILKGDRVIAVSNAVKVAIMNDYKVFLGGIKKGNRKIIDVVYRAIDTNLYNQKNVSENRKLILQSKLKLPDDKIIITLPARFTEQKGQKYFLKVLKNLKYENYMCIMIGDIKKNPKFVREIEKTIYKYQLENHVKIHENINDMPSLYALSNIIVSSSIVPEAFGRISIEAQSMEKIFVGSNIGGTLETVIDNKTGFLASSKNPADFASVLDYVINMKQDALDEIRKNARNNVLENYTFDIMYNKMLKVYNSLTKVYSRIR